MCEDNFACAPQLDSNRNSLKLFILFLIQSIFLSTDGMLENYLNNVWAGASHCGDTFNVSNSPSLCLGKTLRTRLQTFTRMKNSSPKFMMQISYELDQNVSDHESSETKNNTLNVILCHSFAVSRVVYRIVVIRRISENKVCLVASRWQV